MRETRRPKVRFPAGACDCHAHLFVPGAKLAPDSHYRPPECSLADYVRMLRTIGCERGVLVQPSVYGTDNSAFLEALKSGAFPLRGVAVLPETVSDKELEDLHVAGYRGVRINLASGARSLGLEQAPRLAARIKPLGWHLQVYLDFTPEIGERLAKLPVPVVIDHFGRIPASAGVASPAFQSLLNLLNKQHVWAKLMGPYFVSGKFPAYEDVAPLAQAMVKVAPDRLVWGTDWPHPGARQKMPNDGDLADLLAEWVPDEAQRRRILVDNPARLYDFP